MSGYDAGSLFVRIVPTAEGFGQAAAAEIRRQAPAVQAAAQQSGVTRPGGDAQVKALQQSAAAAGATLSGLAKDAERVSLQLLVGEKTLAQATPALEAYALAGVAAAEANVKLALATGEAVAAADIQILTARRQAAAEGQVVGEQERHAQRFRQQARLVAEGEAPLGSLFGPASLARFAAGGLAFGAVITTLQQVEKGLRVTGDEAFTTEGKLRNLGASILTGNIVGAVEALTAHADSASEALSKLLAAAGTSTVDLRNFATNTADAAKQADAFAAATDNSSGALTRGGGRFAGVSSAARETAKAEREAAAEATNLAKAFDTSAQAAQDVVAEITAAGSAAPRFGEANRISTGSDQGRRGSSGGTGDSTATEANQRAIEDARVQRTKGLRDDLALAQARERAAEKKQAAFAAAGDVEGAKERQRVVEEARTQVAAIQDQIDQQESAAAATAAQKAKQLAAAREQASKDAAAARLAQQQAARAAAASEVDRRLALDDLRIQQADLTKGNDDNIRAIDKKIRDLQAFRAKTKQYSQEWIAYTAQITDLRLTLQNLGSTAKSQSGAGGFSVQDLFLEAAGEFATFGSNISRGGPLSGQDARAAFSRGELDNIPAQQLTEAQRTNLLLEQLLRNTIDPAWTKKTAGLPTNPNAGGYKFSSGFAARAAAVSQFGAG